jgi:flagellar basal-body rod protein FlgC
MSLLNVFNIAGSGMSAQATRLNTVSSNMANANNISGNKDELYRAKNPVFSTVMEQVNGVYTSAGVRVDSIQESTVEPSKRYDPNNPLADKDGYIYKSNVNIMEEMANMISASRSYQNNVEILNTAKQMMLATLKLGE